MLKLISLVWLAAKGLKFSQVLLTGGTMFLTVWVQGQAYGLPFALGFVLLILVHELGHAFAIKRAGLQMSWPVFIPFLGAFISWSGKIRSKAVEAEISYAGPLLGTVGACAAAVVHLVTGSQLFLLLAYTAFFLNLFNLCPIPPLDGGGIASLFSRRAWMVGALLMGALLLVAFSPQLLIIALMSVYRLWQPPPPPEHEQEPVTDELRRLWAVRYFGLTAFVAAATFLTHRMIQAGLDGG